MIQRRRLVQMVSATLSLGRPLFSLAITALGFETLLFAGRLDDSYSRVYYPPYEVVPVIPWLPSLPPWLTYVFGATPAVCGLALLFTRTSQRAAMVAGGMMFLGAIFLNVPKYAAHLGDMSIRTEVFEPLSLASLAWLLRSKRNPTFPRTREPLSPRPILRRVRR
jgi:hypothetical protein